jgi:hypothetical protein
MKKLKKLLLHGILALALVCSATFGLIKISGKTAVNKADAAVVNALIFNDVTITKDGQVLDSSNFIEYENSSYIVSNGSITFTLSPLEKNYQVQIDDYESDFYQTIETITLEKDSLTGNYPSSFEFNNKTYYFVYSSQNRVLNLYKNSPSTYTSPTVTTNQSNVISYAEISDTLIITFTTAYTWKSTASDAVFKFVNPTTINSYEVHLLRPKVNFANGSNAVVMFNTFETDDEGQPFDPTNIIQREQKYGKMQIDFLNNTYTEENPLYFNINYNGFIYSFEFFSKEYDGTNLLFVNYVDENNPNNDQYLATGLVSNGDNTFITTNNTLSANDFLSLIFTNTGRYSFEIYDSTYLCGMNDANYYSTSFYIVDENASAFENLYMIAQTLDETNTPLEYIVSTSTINYTTKLTVKNLTNLGTDVNLSDIIENIEIVKAIFGASDNEPLHTSYSVDQILGMIDANGDLNFTFTDDAYYEIYIYPKDTNLERKRYTFTLIKQAKTSMTIQGEKFEASEPYKTTIKNYQFNINSPVGIIVKFTSTNPTSDTILNKTYANKYQIKYGMQQVSLSSSIADDTLSIVCSGVGDLTVTVEFNGETSTYTLNSEEGRNSVTFSEYGTYKVRIVDSMGTETAGVFTLSKSLNTSAIVLIALSSVLALFIIVFILLARSKVKTR